MTETEVIRVKQTKENPWTGKREEETTEHSERTNPITGKRTEKTVEKTVRE